MKAQTDSTITYVVIRGAIPAELSNGKIYVNSSGNTVTVTTNEPNTPVGDTSDGLLTFDPDQGATACNSGGVTSATIRGWVGTGGSA